MSDTKQAGAPEDLAAILTVALANVQESDIALLLTLVAAALGTAIQDANARGADKAVSTRLFNIHTVAVAAGQLAANADNHADLVNCLHEWAERCAQRTRPLGYQEIDPPKGWDGADA